MVKKKKTFTFTQQEWSPDCEVVECPEYDGYKDFRLDLSGFYILVRLEWDIPRIAVAVCDKDHKIQVVFKGRRSQDIYSAMFKYEREHKVEWFKEKTHLAYLGKELKKAEIALAVGIRDYFQE